MLLIRSKKGHSKDETYVPRRGLFASLARLFFGEVIAPYVYGGFVAGALLGVTVLGMNLIGHDTSYLIRNVGKHVHLIILMFLAIFHVYRAISKTMSLGKDKK